MEPFPPWTWEIPEQFNIGTACTDAHLGTPIEGRTAVLVEDAAGDIRRLTFRELADRTGRFAQLLRDLGVGAGDRVLIRLPNCIEYPIVFLGAMKRAAIPVPTSILLTAEEIAYLARDSGCSAVVTDADGWQAIGPALAPLDGVRYVLLVGSGAENRTAQTSILELSSALASVSCSTAAERTRAEDPAYLVYTSGTTGYPKGVLHAHRALLGRQPASEYWFDFLPGGDRVLHSGKFNWTYVLGTGMMDPLFRGHTAILYEGPADPAVWPRLIARHGATTFIGVPTLYRQIVQRTGCSGPDVPTLRHCMCAGEHLSEELLVAWRDRFGLDLHEGLGMSECSYYVSQTARRPVRAGTVGFVQPGHRVALLDPDTLAPRPAGAVGMLCIDRTDPGLMLGYWNRPDETDLCFRDGWFLTGDFARTDDDGYLRFVGRRDDIIKSFGYRVSPQEVERVLRQNPAVLDVAVTGEEAGGDKVIVAAYVVARRANGVTPDEVLAYARAHLAPYKAPRAVYFVDDLPRTRNGKLRRHALSPGLARERSS